MTLARILDEPMRFLFMVALIAGLVGCAGFQGVEPLQQGLVAGVALAAEERATQLHKVFNDYRGTPYRYGGNDRDGFDCSGFISTAYQEAFGRLMPRTTMGLATGGEPIRFDQIVVGDILIFQTSLKQLHAGIYFGTGRFIHASTSQGVTLSYLDNRYWKQRYLKARRYF